MGVAGGGVGVRLILAPLPPASFCPVRAALAVTRLGHRIARTRRREKKQGWVRAGTWGWATLCDRARGSTPLDARSVSLEYSNNGS